MAKLSSKQRGDLPEGDFAEPGARKYPINDPSHARNALARVSQNGTPEEKAQVQRAVSQKYPKIGKKPVRGSVKLNKAARKSTARKRS